MKSSLVTLVACLLLMAACGGRSDGGNSGDRAPNNPALGPDTAPASADSTLPSANSLDSKVVITSNIRLEVDSLRQTFSVIAGMARQFGGYVAESQYTDGESGSANLRLRVPANRHDELLGALRGFDGANLRREESNAQEVTAEYVDLEARIRNLERSENSYQGLLSLAATSSDILQYNAKLDEVRGQIERVRGRLNLLGDLTAFATVSVSLSTPAASANVPAPVEVAVKAFEAFMIVAIVVLNGLLIVAIGALWLVPMAVGGVLAWKLVGRRLRDLGVRIISW